MRILFSFLLLTLSTAVLSQDATQETTETTPTTVPTTTSSAVETTTGTDVPTTTNEPVTTRVPVTTSTKEPVTTSTKEPVTTSTKEPVTTTTKEPVTTPAPASEPCTFNVTRSGVTCIMAELKAKFIIPNEGNETSINLGCDANYERSDCSLNETQTLNLEGSNYNLTMIFEKDGDKVYVRNVTFEYTLPGGESGFGASHDKLFNVKAGNSYLCRSETKVKLDNVTMEISEIHIQAFEEKNSEKFGTAEECEADDKVSDIVPIAVGVALAALIIIVLIAYLVGRRRSRQKGYQSV